MPTTTLRAIALISALLLPSMTHSQDKDKAPKEEAAAKPKAASGEKPESLKERVSYSYGVMIARQLSERGIELDMNQFSKAFKMISAGEESILDEDEIGAAFRDNQKIIDEKNVGGDDKETLLAGKKFLAENGKKKGVTTTTSGLQYEVMKAGDGEKPKATDRVCQILGGLNSIPNNHLKL